MPEGGTSFATSGTASSYRACSTLVALLVGVPAGYGIARARANRLAAFVLVSRITPGLSYLIPLFILFRYLDLHRQLCCR